MNLSDILEQTKDSLIISDAVILYILWEVKK